VAGFSVSSQALLQLLLPMMPPTPCSPCRIQPLIPLSNCSAPPPPPPPHLHDPVVGPKVLLLTGHAHSLPLGAQVGGGQLIREVALQGALVWALPIISL
jgi:hypothetical protein